MSCNYDECHKLNFLENPDQKLIIKDNQFSVVKLKKEI